LSYDNQNVIFKANYKKFGVTIATFCWYYLDLWQLGRSYDNQSVIIRA